MLLNFHKICKLTKAEIISQEAVKMIALGKDILVYCTINDHPLQTSLSV